MNEKQQDSQTDIFPNKNRMIRALDIYTTAMRDIVIDHLKEISNESLPVKELVSASLPPNLYEKDISPLRSETAIHDALEEKHFPYLLKNNWDECFKTRYGNGKKMICIKPTTKLVSLRNKLAHRRGGDPDDTFTLRHLDLIMDILHFFERVNEYNSVQIIRNELTEKAEAVSVTEEENLQQISDESEKAAHEADAVIDSKQPALTHSSGLTVKPIKDIHNSELGNVLYENGESFTAWLFGDEIWTVYSSETSIVAERVEGTRVDTILALEEDITQLWFAQNYASDEEDDWYQTEDGNWIDLLSIEGEIGKLERCKAELIPGLFDLPFVNQVSSGDEDREGKEVPMSVYAVGGSTRLGTDTTTGESFWKVGDSYWRSTERRNTTTAVKMDEEEIRRSRVISRIIPE